MNKELAIWIAKVIIWIVIGSILAVSAGRVLRAEDKPVCISDVKAPDTTECYVWLAVVMR